jgi:hypothetical protein
MPDGKTGCGLSLTSLVFNDAEYTAEVAYLRMKITVNGRTTWQVLHRNELWKTTTSRQHPYAKM